MQVRCVHANTPYNDPAVSCGKSVFRRTHGYLCLTHYREQQQSIPAKPRKPQPVWIGFKRQNMNDAEIVHDILTTDAKCIESGTVQVVRLGAIDPLYVRYLV